jgi:hypothetical protein
MTDFFWYNTSWSTCLSRLRSATSRFSFRFSSTGWLGVNCTDEYCARNWFPGQGGLR